MGETTIKQQSKVAGTESEQTKTINEKYLNALRDLGDWVTISEWAEHFAKMYPDQLEKAERQAAGQKNETTGLREIAARMSSQTSRGAFGNNVEVDASERPKRVRWLSEEAAEEHEKTEIDEDLEPLRRSQKIKQDRETYSPHDRYRTEEFEEVVRQLNFYFGTDFELDHAQALLNRDNPGHHRPENFQILLKSHNRKKNNSNWPRFNLDEQIEYLHSIIAIQRTLSKRLNIAIDDQVVISLVARLKNIY